MDPQRNDAVILTQEFAGSSSTGVSSFQMFEDERMNIVNFRGAMMRKRPYRPICISYRTGRHCRRADKCPFRHEMPKTHIPQQQRIDPQINDAVIPTQELGGSSSSENQGASSFQMPPQD